MGLIPLRQWETSPLSAHSSVWDRSHTMSTIQDTLRALMEPRGFNQKSLAVAAGLNETAVRDILKGKSKNPTGRTLNALAGALGVDVADLMGAGAAPPPATPLPDGAVPFAPVTVPQPHEFARGGLPVLGTGACHSTEFNGGVEFGGEVVDRVGMPPSLANVKGAYGLYAAGSSMEPRYHPGELVYVHPHKAARAGDYVVVQMFADDDGGVIIAMIKRLVSRDNDKLVLEQFNPPRRFDVPADKVRYLHRILTGDELF